MRGLRAGVRAGEASPGNLLLHFQRGGLTQDSPAATPEMSDARQRAAADMDMLAPWRKTFPICKPYEGGTSEDAARFLKDFIDGLDDIDSGTSGNFTLGDVALGVHEGGNAPTATPIAGAAATVASKTRARDQRRKKLASTLKKYILIESIKSSLTSAATSYGLPAELPARHQVDGHHLRGQDPSPQDFQVRSAHR